MLFHHARPSIVIVNFLSRTFSYVSRKKDLLLIEHSPIQYILILGSRLIKGSAKQVWYL